MDERNKCFIDFYRFIDTIDINQIRFTLLIDISILIFIDLLLRANWQQKTTLHVQHTFLPLFCTTTTWNFLVSRFMEKPWMSYVGTKDFFACVMARSIPSVPIPRAFVRHLSFCFGKAANNAPRWRGPGVHTKTPRWGLKTKQRKVKRPTQTARKNYCKKDHIRPSDQYQWQNYKLEF